MKPTGAERRKSRRRGILSSFAVSVVVPRKGPNRLEILDVSDAGLGFVADIEDEAQGDYAIEMGDEMEVELYLNQSLHLTLGGRVARVESKGGLRRIGFEIVDTRSPGYRAYLSFLGLIDALVDTPEASTG